MAKASAAKRQTRKQSKAVAEVSPEPTEETKRFQAWAEGIRERPVETGRALTRFRDLVQRVLSTINLGIVNDDDHAAEKSQWNSETLELNQIAIHACPWNGPAPSDPITKWVDDGILSSETAELLIEIGKEFGLGSGMRGFPKRLDPNWRPVKELLARFLSLTEPRSPVVARDGSIQKGQRKLPPATKPEWDKANRVLEFRGKRIIEFKRTAGRLIEILDAFQRHGWPNSIDKPTGMLKQARIDAVGNLNRKSTGEIVFALEGHGAKIGWFAR